MSAQRRSRSDPPPQRSDASDPPRERDSIVRALEAATHLVAFAMVAATVVVCAQPIYANDTWLHLALGRVFAADGPWLATDPFLFAAPGPPAPSSWLGSVAIYGIERLGGFDGLRIVHGLFVLGLLVLAWRVLRRSGAPPPLASAGVVGFVVLSTYRLVQLRPELFTIAAALSLYPLFVADRTGPDLRRMAVAVPLGIIWANVHAAFVLGPLLLVGTGAVVGASSILPRADDERRALRGRGARIAATGAVLLAASLVHPMGLGALLAYTDSGRSTPGLEAISDEWNPTNLLAWPLPFLPPTEAAWLLAWLCLVLVAAAALAFARAAWRRGSLVSTVDPALLALAGAGLVAALRASRFLWLGIFALASGAALVAGMRRWPRLQAGLVAAFAGTAAMLHFGHGDWSIVAREMRAPDSDYRAPYSTTRFNATPVWFLADTGVEGRIFNDYPLGGFMSFWLSPALSMSSNGSMNVSRDAMDAHFAIGSRQQVRADERFEDLLDRQGLDLFLGLGLPIEATAGRPVPCTVRHLEHVPDWILVFRNLRSAVYLRRGERNAANLARVVAYYERRGVPFDPERGFEVERVVGSARAWAVENGLIPTDYDALVADVEAGLRAGRVDDRARRLAVLEATLGRYDRALALEREIQRIEPLDADSVWRTIWSLAQQDRWSEAFDVATRFERALPDAARAAAFPWSNVLEPARQLDPAGRATLIAHLPLFRESRLGWVLNDVRAQPPRLERSSGVARGF